MHPPLFFCPDPYNPSRRSARRARNAPAVPSLPSPWSPLAAMLRFARSRPQNLCFLRETMLQRRLLAGLAICLALASFTAAKTSTAKSSKSKRVAGLMPVTAASAKAREMYQKGMQDYENLYLERCNEDWRAAVKEDPSIAMAWAWIAFNSRNPVEVRAAREKAKALLPQVTPGEKLMIQWIANVQEGNYIAGISAMNDMLAMFPKDKHLLYLDGNWPMG